MLPVNADEANFAALCIGAQAQAADCLRQARAYANDLGAYLKCTAQAARMLREARSTRALLLRLQTERRRRDADPATADRDAWTEHCAIGWMTGAPAAAASEASPPAPPPSPPEPDEPAPDAEPDRDLAAEVAQYAAIYPDRARLIRAHGRVPDSARFGPPDDTLVRAIVAGATPALLAVDRFWAERISARDSVAAHAT